jgi:chemotaxis protein MotB
MSDKKQRREKSGGDEGGGPSAPFWMVTYSDMVTLLLTFFVMLLAMANFEEVGRVDAVFESIRLALGVDGKQPDVNGIEIDQPKFDQDIQEENKLEPIMSKLQDALSHQISDSMIEMTQKKTEIRVLLDDQVLFKPGSAEVHPAMYLFLSDIGSALADQPVTVKVEGHTDETGDPGSNWELSADRAVAVVVALQKRGGMDGSQLEARGMGEFHPANLVDTDRDWDRRVELIIKADTGLAQTAIYEVERVTNGGRDGG